MKKKIYGILLVFMIVLLSGCGSKKELNCKYARDDIKVEYNFKFKDGGKKLEKFEIVSVNDYTAYKYDNEDLYELLEETKKETCGFYNLTGVTCDATRENSIITVKIDVDMESLDSNAKAVLSTDEIDSFSIDDMKNYMESNASFTCE